LGKALQRRAHSIVQRKKEKHGLPFSVPNSLRASALERVQEGKKRLHGSVKKNSTRKKKRRDLNRKVKNLWVSELTGREEGILEGSG